MQQRDLNRAVARATGETVSTVERTGFVLLDEDRDETPIESDEREAARNVQLVPQRRLPPLIV